MKILFVCFPYSIHAARWTRLLDNLGWDLHVFPSQINDGLHEAFRGITYWAATPADFLPPNHTVKVGNPSGAACLTSEDLSERLAETISNGKFDVVHSLEFQHAGYLSLAVAEKLGTKMPPWIATNYGSDIYFYGNQPGHREKIRSILDRCDYYSAECRRDLALARAMGFRKKVFAIEPNGGGVDIGSVPQDGVPSSRRTIAVKGYQHFAGRALTALEALRKCGHWRLRGYELVVYAAFPEVRALAETMAQRGFNIRCLPDQVPHQDILKLHGRSRISIAISAGDGISTSLLEAMAMGSFPIQTNTACADEWIVDGETGYIVDVDSVRMIAKRIKMALKDDAMVDAAASRNADVIGRRASPASISQRISSAYLEIGRT